MSRHRSVPATVRSPSIVSPHRFHLTARTARWLGACLLLAFAAFAWRVVPAALHGARGSFLAFSDFFSQWSFGLFARLGSVGQIYDGDALHRFQLTLEPALRQTFPYAYPPSYLFAVWPLSWMPYGAGYLAWDGVTLALFIWAVFGSGAWNRYLPFVVLAPATIICLTQGQSGLLASALIVGGMRLVGTRPVLGGALLGLATIKPQTGMLLPVALIAAGQWRAIAAAAASAVLLAAASGLAFGWTLWLDWWNGLATYAGYLDRSVGNYLKPGIMANLVLFGVAVPVAHAVQGGIGVVVAVVVFLCCRRGISELSIAVTQVGTFLAMPFVFRYDMPMLVNAILLSVRDREQARHPVGPIEAGILVLGLLAPGITTVTTRFFYVSGLSLLLLFGLVVWRWMREASPLAERGQKSYRAI
jgi:Glycosyltransferase family 87